MPTRISQKTRLDAYLTSASVLRNSCQQKPDRQWLAYAAAASAALTMVPAAEAAPIYSGPQNLTLNLGNAAGTLSTGVDMDLDGDPDFFAFLSRFFAGQVGSFQAALSALTSNAVLVNNATYGSVRRLASSAFLSGGVGVFSHSAFNILHGVTTSNGVVANRYGTWCGVGAPQCSNLGFAGVRFERLGFDHFGWIRLHVANENDRPTAVTVLDWAYESEPGATIHAAAPVPEPSSLALLATGAAALLARRRMRRMTTPSAQPSAGAGDDRA